MQVARPPSTHWTRRTSASAPATKALATDPAVRSVMTKDCLKPRERRRPKKSPVIKNKGGKGAGKGKDKGKGKSKGTDAPKEGAKELCLRFMKGECAKSSAECRFSHAAKRINALVAAVGAAQQKGYVVASPSAQAPTAPPGLRHSSLAVQGAAQLNALAPVYTPAANALSWIRPEQCVIFCGDITQQSFPQVSFVDVAASSSNLAIRSLDDLPKDIWEFVPEPPSGYHYRTLTQVGVEEVETLLDGGSVFSLMSEEYFVELINAATSRGMTPAHEDWPIAGLQHWGADSPASTMSKGPALLLRAIALLRITL